MDEKREQAMSRLALAGLKLSEAEELIRDAQTILGRPEALRGVRSSITAAQSNVMNIGRVIAASSES